MRKIVPAGLKSKENANTITEGMVFLYMHVTCSIKCKLTSDSHIVVVSLWKLTQSRKEAVKKIVHSLYDYKSYYWIVFSDKYIYQSCTKSLRFMLETAYHRMGNFHVAFFA